MKTPKKIQLAREGSARKTSHRKVVGSRPPTLRGWDVAGGGGEGADEDLRGLNSDYRRLLMCYGIY